MKAIEKKKILWRKKQEWSPRTQMRALAMPCSHCLTVLSAGEIKPARQLNEGKGVSLTSVTPLLKVRLRL